MASSYDPYKPPVASLEGGRSPDSGQAVPDAVVDLLIATRPWVKMFSILTFIGVGLGTLFLISALTMGRPFMDPKQIWALIPAMILLALYVPAGVFLSRYAGGITRLQRGEGVPALEAAVSSQKSFWKYLGILTVIVIGLYILIIAGAIMVGVSMRR